MSLLELNRPERLANPHKTDPTPIKITEPSSPPAARTASLMMCLFPVVGAVGVLGFSLANPQPRYLLTGLISLMGSVALGAGMYWRQLATGKAAAGEGRAAYLTGIADARDRLTARAATQRAAALWTHPDPTALWTAARNPARCWERRPGSEDFLWARVGMGPGSLDLYLDAPAPAGPMARRDPICESALRGLLHAFETVPGGLPLTLPFAKIGLMAVTGPAVQSAATVCAALAQLVTFHPPEDLRLAVCRSPDRADRWDWVKWLPHVEHPEAVGGDGPVRLIAADLAGLDALLGRELAARRATRRGAGAGPAGPHLVIVLDLAPSGAAADAVGDGEDLAAFAEPDGLLALAEGSRVSVVACAFDGELAPARVDRVLDVVLRGRRADVTLRAGDGTTLGAGWADLVSPAGAEAVARALCPLRLTARSRGRAVEAQSTIADLLELADPATLDVATAWRPRPEADRLRVPLGISQGSGEPVYLDLKDHSVGGMGSHGLLVGASGSGKSELMRTLLVALAIRHPPSELAFVLVDFKGGATFSRLRALPHRAGLITNLENPRLAGRALVALNGEVDRRLRVLSEAGELDSVDDYRRLRATARPDLAPLPSLFVVVDEFGELLVAQPEFTKLFSRIGRVGRALGIHLLLASQRLEEGGLRDLEHNVHYRIALRTFKEQDSRAALGVSDAFRLPAEPGWAYLQVDGVLSEPWRSARASATYRPGTPAGPAPGPVVRRFTALSPSLPDRTDRPAPEAVGSFGFDDDPARRSIADVVVDRLRAAAGPVDQVWLDPPGGAIPLDAVPWLPELADASVGVGLSAAIGLVDEPAKQRQRPLVVDLAGTAGHAVVVGASAAGKSTLLRTLIAAFARTYGPRDVQFYCVDLGGGLLGALDGLPQVGSVAGRGEPERLRRVVVEMHTLMSYRREAFPAAGIDAMSTFRARRRGGAGSVAGGYEDGFGDAVLVIDNWAQFVSEHEDLVPRVLEIAANGLTVGVHLVLGASRWQELRPQLRDTLGTKLELRLGNPGDSEIDRGLANLIPADAPGRGLVAESPSTKLEFQVALPRVDGQASVDGLGAAVAALVAAERARWPAAEAARPVRVLPTSVPRASLRPADPSGRAVPIGVSETDLSTVDLDLSGRDPSFLVFGDGGSGKSAFLRSWLAGLQETVPRTAAKILVIDYRRSLLGAVRPDFLVKYCGAAPAAAEGVAGVMAALAKRVPGSDVSAEQLAARNWWAGPDVYVVVDDYDLATASAGSPLAPLVPYLPIASDLGLHLVLARRVGGLFRAGGDPVLGLLRDLATPGLVLSGEPQEGAVIGAVRAQPQPPGRGLLAYRGRRPTLVQLAWDPPGKV